MDPEVAAVFRSSTKVSRKYQLYLYPHMVSYMYSDEGYLGQPDAGWQQT